MKKREPCFFPWAHSEAHGVPSQHQEALCSCEGDQTLVRVPEVECPSQRYSKTVWTWSWAIDPGWPRLSRGVGLYDHQRSHSASPSFWDNLSSSSNAVSLSSSWIVCIAVQFQHCLEDGCGMQEPIFSCWFVIFIFHYSS